MADSTPQYEHGSPGDPLSPPMAQGAATALNEASQESPTAAAPAGGPGGPPSAGAPAPPDAFSVPTPPLPSVSAGSDEERYLLAPPRDGEPTSASNVPNAQDGGLGLLDEAAQDPSAPPQVALLRNLIADHLSR